MKGLGRVAMQDRSRPVSSSGSVIGWETRPVLILATGLGFATRPWFLQIMCQGLLMLQKLDTNYCTMCLGWIQPLSPLSNFGTIKYGTGIVHRVIPSSPADLFIYAVCSWVTGLRTTFGDIMQSSPPQAAVDCQPSAIRVWAFEFLALSVLVWTSLVVTMYIPCTALSANHRPTRPRVQQTNP